MPISLYARLYVTFYGLLDLIFAFSTVFYVSQHFFLVVVSECHYVLDQSHPYYLLFGPRGLRHFDAQSLSSSSLPDSPVCDPLIVPNENRMPRIICFTSALLPSEITDPSEAEQRLKVLEERTNCRVETASELLTMLSLGARPKERVLLCTPHNVQPTDCAVHIFTARILDETCAFLHDVLPSSFVGMSTSSTDLNTTDENTERAKSVTHAPDSRGRMICVLDYCRRAVIQCQEILAELGVWCAAQIARVFVRHLISLERRRARLLEGNSKSKSFNGNNGRGEDQLTRLLRSTITQLCIIVRLFQVEFDTCMTLETFQTMVSPKALTLVNQLKVYKPSMNFRIEVAELPPATMLKSEHRGSSVSSTRRRSRRYSTDSESKSVTSVVKLLPGQLSDPSDSSVDTMSSVSDADEQVDGRSTSSRRSSLSRGTIVRSNGSKRKTRRSNKKLPHTTMPKTRDLHFRPTASLVNGGLLPGVDPSQLVYRAVLTPGPDGSRPVPPVRLCGLVLVSCQFTAYALSRLIDELCIWDVDLFFIKPGHLFSRQTVQMATNGSGADQMKTSVTCAANQTALKTGDESVADVPNHATSVHSTYTFDHSFVAPHGYGSVAQTSLPATQEETIEKFRRGAINLLIATQPAVSAAAGGAELPRCNLVVAFQPPHSLSEYLSSKARSRLVDHGAQVIYLVDECQSEHSRTDGDLSPELSDKLPSSRAGTPQVLQRFQKLEQLLVERCRGYHLFSDEHNVDPAIADQLLPPVMPRGPNGPKLPLSKAINVINQYCARLPSDYITNLTPRWRLKMIPQSDCWSVPSTGPGASCGALGEQESVRAHGLYQCLLRLPINTSVKEEIAGEPMACKKLAKLSAALNAVRILHAAGELDSRWEPSSREPTNTLGASRDSLNSWIHQSAKTNRLSASTVSLFQSESVESDMNDLLTTCNPDSTDGNSFGLDGIGRRRRYYYRKFADQLHNCLPQPGDPSPNYLYFIDMRLTNALPAQQNVRGRPCFRPENEPLGFGLLTLKPLHHIPTFPIFSRSGEETVRLVELWSPLALSHLEPNVPPLRLPMRGQPLNEQQIGRLYQFHRIVFQAVLRLEREAVIEFNMEKAYSQVIVVPVRKDTLDLDWDFIAIVLSSYTPEGVCRLAPRRDLSKSVIPANVHPRVGHSDTNKPPTARGRVSFRTRHSAAAKSSMENNPLFGQGGMFDFRAEDFENAVVMPGYRNLDQPQHYYVAEIRFDLSPLSPFPSSSYTDFATYYTSRYDVALTTMKQPLLDVDFTVLRLNLLVPRYLNVRGQCLPCSSDIRRRDRRESLTHKQILIPELCFRHPFPASVWRKAVCLPSILYRLHSLLLAEDLRRLIAYETNMGRARLPKPSQISVEDFLHPELNGATTVRDLFEPLRLVFPLQVQRAVDDDLADNLTIASEGVLRRRRRCRGRRNRHSHPGGEPKTQSKDSAIDPTLTRNSGSTRHPTVPSSGLPVHNNQEPPEGELEDDEDVEDNDVDDQTVAVAAKSTDSAHTSSSTVVKLHAASTMTSTTAGTTCVVNSKLETLLQETKVIEWDGTDDYQSYQNPDSSDLILVENRVNTDREYLGIGSDVESVDSFERNVHFFPSEDDDEIDSQEESDPVGSIHNFSNLTLDEMDEQTQVTWSRTPRAYRPGPANVLQALTLSCSNDFVNLERMETIGDSFLKFVVTVHLYLLYPNAHEGKLSHLRSRVVCNSNLYRLGRAKHLQDRIIASKFSPYENWVPPGYVVRHDPRLYDSSRSGKSGKQGSEPAVDLNIWSTDTLMDDEVLLGTKVWEENTVQPIDNFAISDWDPSDPEVVRTQQRVDHCLVTIQQTIPDKSVADCVEALIGCYLTSRGERSALRLMRWFGIDCLPTLDDAQLLRTRGAPWSSPLPSIPPDDPRAHHLAEARLAWRFDELEAKLQYRFRDPALLIQAFTHPSYHQLRQTPSSDPDADPLHSTFLTDTDCYQRLEFLGDAVLDYVITRFLYEDSQQHSPGVLTDLRSALVNNNIFAALAVRIGLHQFLRASSPQLLHTIDAFVHFQKDVVKDDLDFVTNEDIEVRQPDPVDPLSEEAVLSEPTRADNGISVIRPSGDEVNMDEEDQQETGTVDATLLSVANEQETCWRRKDAEQLVGQFLDKSTTASSLEPDPHVSPTAPVESATQSCRSNVMTSRVSDDVEIPKALGDIFESLAGAVFLDSGLSLDTVWAVFYPLMKERIERYTACIPKSPVRQLLELEPEGTKFERPRRTADGRISVCAHVLGKGRFYGIGRNYRLAKSLAAKRALRVLRTLQAAATQPSAVTTFTDSTT
ncbi:endoribonuclease Dicer [Paragonimus westermani]|uniref:Endoribonuclease Dicer n=1 Tax=Paragonimus westermani TaxID=34504 RepID=A0A5J4NPQ6_9TREM|nr:endoribonuclease Dicer [Paragonimus westermani]